MVGSEESALNPLDRLRRDLYTITRAGIAAADAGRLLERALAAAPQDCFAVQPVTLVAAGKAAAPMASAFARWGRVALDAALVVSTHADVPLPASFEWRRGAHPVPSDESEQAGRRALELAAGARALVVLLSGGASSLLAVPADGVTLADKRLVTSRLLAAGADIHALNSVRKHLSAIKGGRLAAAVRGPTLALAVSDVMGDDLSVIGSGPTVADPTTFRDALDVVDRFGGRHVYPPSVVHLLETGARGRIPESPKPGDPRLERAETRLVGSRRNAAEGAQAAAHERGYATVLLDEPLVGEARAVAPGWVERMARMAERVDGPVAVISTGETTVRVVGNGRGGRNQELVLAALPVLERLDRDAAFASVGTDGIDGPTDAAGAMATCVSARRLAALGLSTADALDRNDSYTLFEASGDLVRTGPTSTNVGDLQVLLLGAR
jgi:hydroxypyruvate reductase